MLVSLSMIYRVEAHIVTLLPAVDEREHYPERFVPIFLQT